MSGFNDGFNSKKYRKSERKFVVGIHEGEMEQISQWVMKKDNIETGGDLFGLWIDQHNAVVQFVLGPGKHCRRTTTSFFQDVKYLDKAGQHLIKHHGLCNIGQWHSHHRINLPCPSGGDERTVWGNMPQLGMSRYIVFIANIKSSGQAMVNCFLFEIENGCQLPVLHGEFKVLKNINSPFRLNESVLNAVYDGAESFNEIDADKNEKSDVGKEIEPSPYFETDYVKIEGKLSSKDHGNAGRGHEVKASSNKRKLEKKKSEEKRYKVDKKANTAPNQVTEAHIIKQGKNNSGHRGSDQGTNKAGEDKQHQFTSESFSTPTRVTVTETTAEDVPSRATFSPANDASKEVPPQSYTANQYRQTEMPLHKAPSYKVTFLGAEDSSSQEKTNVSTPGRELLKKYRDERSGNFIFPVGTADGAGEPPIQQEMISSEINDRDNHAILVQPQRENPHGQTNTEFAKNRDSLYDNVTKNDNKDINFSVAMNEQASQHEVPCSNTPSETAASQPRNKSDTGKTGISKGSKDSSWFSQLFCCSNRDQDPRRQ